MTDSSEPPITVSCSPNLKDCGFDVQEIGGHEELGCLFEYHLHLVSHRHDIDLKSLLGETMTVHVPLGPEQVRHLSGIVFRAERGQRRVTHTEYRVTLLPEQHLLSFCHDCRIFQNAPVVEVVRQILEKHKLRPLQTSLYESEGYRHWDYLTQYQESDWDFVRRILALEGIYFYFNHLEDGHEMVLADSISSHHAREGWETVPLLAQVSRGANPDCLRQWREASEVRTGDVVLRDFEFRLQGGAAILAGKKGMAATEKKWALQRYEYPGGFVMAENSDGADAGAGSAEGERLARVRLEEKQSGVEIFVGEGTARGLGVGSLFGISEVPELAGRQFMITSTEVMFRNPAVETGGLVNDKSYVRLTAIDHATPFRMCRLEKPIVRGPQTARVVGPKDEEIWTDRYGRIKVQFHWDREGVCDENSSCWVRVAHPWAGNRWGAIHLPRVGNEVVVEFLEGDPDRPLVTGSVYNADNMPPYTLPEHKTQSGIKTHSSKGGTEANFNEIRFEDKKGHEELHIQAERNMSTLVKHDQSLTVQADRKVTVHGNETIEVTGTRDTKINNNETQTFNFDRKMTVEGTNTDDIKGAHTGIYYGGRTEVVETGDTLLVVGSHKTTTVEGEYNVVANEHYSVTSGGKSTCNVDLKEGVVTITAENEINLVCGDASLSLKKDGTVTIQGKNTLSAIGAKSKLELASAGAKLSGADAMTEISGGMVKING